MNNSAPKIIDRQSANLAMNKLMDEILLQHKGDQLLQRTSGLTKLQILAGDAGIDLLEWMKLYALLESPETVPITLPPTADQNRIYAVEAMIAVMECYPNDFRKRELHMKRNGYNSLIRFSFRARVPLIEWMVSYFKTTYSIQPIVDTSSPSLYTCPSCNEPFKSADALKGHGPRRCQREKLKTANSHLSHES